MDDIRRMLATHGTIFEAGTILHCMKLPDNEVKVTVEEDLILDALVHVPKDEVYIVALAFQSLFA